MHFIPRQDRYQMTFMSSLDDLVPPDHPVRIIDAIVDSILPSLVRAVYETGSHLS